MTSYMLKSELDAITTKHKHQWGEGMVTIEVAAKNAKDEIISRAIHNMVRESIGRNIDKMLMKEATTP